MTKAGELGVRWTLASFASEKCPRCGLRKAPQRALCHFDLMRAPRSLYRILVSAAPSSEEYRKALLAVIRARLRPPL